MNFQNKINARFIKGLLISTLTIIVLLHACKKIEPERIVILRTLSISNIQYSSAGAEGIIVDIPESGISEHGHCWATTEDPTISSPTKTTKGNPIAERVFHSSLEGLTPGTQYYVRAYAQSGDMVTYGENVSFTTLAGNRPSLNTFEASDVTMNSATCGGEITSENGYTVTSRGICWNTTGNPSVEDDSRNIGSGPGNFSTQITGLAKRTTYYVRAYAINSVGENYGSQIEFTTSDLPSVSTINIHSLTPNSATCIGNVTDDGDTEITERGFCWNNNPGPTIDDDHTPFGNGPGEFSGIIEGLNPLTRVYVRAYATNINGTEYGDDIPILTPFTDDRDGKFYQVTQIGDQYWMAENLNYGNYVSTGTGQSNNEIIEKYCYDNEEANCEIYGGIYSWWEMTLYTSQIIDPVQGVCPSGWHIPSDDEWKELEMAIGLTETEANNSGWRGTDEGDKLKLQGTEYWENTDADIANETGFSALPGGFNEYQEFYGIGDTTSFWTTTLGAEFSYYYRLLSDHDAKIFRRYDQYTFGKSVRCVKD